MKINFNEGPYRPAEQSVTKKDEIIKSEIGQDTLEAIITVTKVFAQSLPDNLALKSKAIYDDFEDAIGQTVDEGFKFRYDGKLYKTIQPSTIIQEQYPPGVGNESLYVEINDTNQGTLNDPVPYNNNMILESGKYYSQNDKIYFCNRDTGQAVYNDLIDLVGLYVEIVE